MIIMTNYVLKIRSRNNKTNKLNKFYKNFNEVSEMLRYIKVHELFNKIETKQFFEERRTKDNIIRLNPLIFDTGDYNTKMERKISTIKLIIGLVMFICWLKYSLIPRIRGIHPLQLKLETYNNELK